MRAAGNTREQDVVDDEHDELAVIHGEIVALDGNAVVSVRERTIPGAFQDVDLRPQIEGIHGVMVTPAIGIGAIFAANAPIDGEPAVGIFAVQLQITDFLNRQIVLFVIF